MPKYTHFLSLLRNGWKILPGAIASLSPFASIEPSPLSRLVVLKNAMNEPEQIELVITEVGPQDLLQEVERLAPLIPKPVAYLSAQVRNGALQVAELSQGKITTHTEELRDRDAATALLHWLHAGDRQHQLIAASIEEDSFEDSSLKDVLAQLWLKEDLVPFTTGRQNPEYRESSEEQVKDVAAHFDAQGAVHIPIRSDCEVEVSELVTLEDYRKTTSPEEFTLLTQLARTLRGKNVIFINATPRGGGVALMRHALIRLLRLLYVDAHWYVLLPQKEVFDITKTKFHNVLQAVARPDTVLTAEEKALYEAWSKENADALNDVFKRADVVVIDDPQPAGLIPYIKQANPDAKIIYRSHIQIVGSLATQEGTPQHTTWSFIWDKIMESDYFVSHPMKMFVPDNVPADKVLYMPATTDPLDGLNKPLTEQQMATYLERFNVLLQEAGQTPLDPTRPYLVQIARFDPSKGIPDLLEAYRKLRYRLVEENRPIPQLVVAGNGSVDDPDGVPIYSHVMQILQSEEYAHFANDIKVVRLHHCDQMLNMLLRKSAIVLQLSIKEGFEVKVTEALMKGKPVVATRVGGIPLQVQDGITGYLVESGNTTEVAQRLYELLTDQATYQRMSEAAAAWAGREYLTIPNAICWLYLALKLVRDEKIEGHFQWVRELAQTEQL